MALNFETRWSQEARCMQPPLLLGIAQRFAGVPGLVGLHAGVPAADAFPVTAIHLELAQTTQPAKSRSQDQHSTTTVNGDSASGRAASLAVHIDEPGTVATAQQYTFWPTAPKGAPDLLSWAGQLTARLHAPACPTRSLLTSGATQAIDLVMRALLDPGAPLLCEEFTYSHALELLFMPRRLQLLAVRMDGEGLDPAHLRQLLRDRRQEGAAMPKVLYTIPTGQNPTGCTMPQQRKRDIYQVCHDYDIVIIEDDAYYFLQYPDGPDNPPGLKLQPGFLNLDVDGRVVRIDTLAKLLGPGYRLGWVTAPPAFAAKLDLFVSGSTVGPSSLAQVAVAHMLRNMGPAGLDAFVCALQSKYARQAATAHALATAKLKGLAEWAPVQAGMFFWLKLTGVTDADEVLSRLVEARVVVAPGKAFWARRSEERASCPYIRISYAYSPEQELKVGFDRLSAALTQPASLETKEA